MDDVSWGTKGSTEGEDRENFTEKKISFVSKWMLSNIILAYFLILLNKLLPAGNIIFFLSNLKRILYYEEFHLLPNSFYTKKTILFKQAHFFRFFSSKISKLGLKRPPLIKRKNLMS